jgi:myo-inositol-1-phosphate synthase
MGEHNNAPVYTQFNKIVQMVDPNKMVVGGWDISKLDMYSALCRAEVLPPEFRDKCKPYLESIVPLPSVYYKDFIASN